jgi:hypothetical protein
MLSSLLINSLVLSSVVSAAHHAGSNPRRHHHRLAKRAVPSCEEGEWQCSGTQLQRQFFFTLSNLTRRPADI